MERKRIIVILGIVAFSCFSFSCWAAEYPSKNIQMVIPYGPGGSVDLSSKTISHYMRNYLGQPMIPVNKPGGGTSIGTKYVITSKPDGYTVLVTTPVSLNFFPKITKAADIGINDITPLFGYAEATLFITVKADAPWKTLGDFVSAAKKNPNQFRHGSWGITSFGNLGMALINHYAGSQSRDVPFKSTGEALTALLGGHVDIVAAAGVVRGLADAGKVRILATSTEKRTNLMPDVPTLTELGYPIVITFHHGFYVPNGTPHQIQDTLIQAAQRALREYPDDIKKQLFDFDMVPAWAGKETYTKNIKEGESLYDFVIDLIKLPVYHKK